ncbi:MAG: ABC-ATPase domain-containing protein [Chloroflexota bacterium]|nr:ABC-ATPase domain-containing protein [Chloroflexota bacterium]
MRRLRDILRRINGRGYKAYQELERQRFQFPGFELIVDHVQGDPFAAPSRCRIQVPQQVAGFPAEAYSTPSRNIAMRDFLVRAFAQETRRVSERRGSGKSGQVFVDLPGQEMLERSGCQVNRDYVELRFFVGLPAAGRRILGYEAEEMLADGLPLTVQAALMFRNVDATALWRHVKTGEDTDALRDALKGLGLVAFIADGSTLPRRSGVDDRPMERAVPFQSPEALRVEVELPNAGKVSGMGIPRGVTLIVGGGFHGKSTLLRGLERGVYNHIPRDGRELVVADPTAVKIRAEDGRSVVGVDISPFIDQLPGGVDTRGFTTENASGSTSQGANIAEALEAGSDLLLVDEDTSATNFMIRDRRMQALVEKRHEPITPFVDQVRRLYRDHGVSTVLVMGGSGDYFDVADTVVAMVEYVPQEVGAEARAIAAKYPTERVLEGAEHFGAIPSRIPVSESMDPRKGRREVHLKARGTRTLLYGREEIELSHVEQIVEDGQVKAIGYAMAHARQRYMDGATPLRDVLERVEADVRRGGLDGISSMPYPPDLVAFRPQELAAAMNRLRSLRVKTAAPA